MAPPSNNKYEMPAIIRKEIRNCIVVKMMSLVYRCNKMTCRKIYALLSDYFHGTNVIKLHLDQCLNKEGCYSPMFSSSTFTVTDSQASCNVVNSTKTLNKEMFCLTTDYVIGKHIVKSVLESKTAKAASGLVSGRMLSDISILVLKNAKKTLAFLKLMPEVVALTPYGVELKSGISEEECKLKLLQLMYTSLKGKDDFDEGDELDNGDKNNNNNLPGATSNTIDEHNNNESIRPLDWYYPGWMAFCLFGPFVVECDRLTILDPSSTKNDTNVSNGRAKQRLQDKLENDVARHKDMTNKRGISYELKLGIANMEIKEEILKQHQKDRKILQLNSAIQIMQQNIDRSENRAKQYCTTYDTTNELWKVVVEYKNESKKLQKELAEVVAYSPPSKRTRIFDSPSPNSKQHRGATSSNIKPPPVQVVTINRDTSNSCNDSSLNDNNNIVSIE